MASSKKKAPAAAPLSRYEKYELAEVHRSELKNAPYNPRKIVESARKNLRRVIEKHGLVEPPVWNARTGNLVGGHQRLGVLDALHGTKDYRLHVARLDVDEAAEKQINLALNNPSVQGDWDLDKLKGLLTEPDFGIEDAGFNLSDVYQAFGESPFAQSTAELVKLTETLAAIKERHRADQQKRKGKSDRDQWGYYRVLVFQNDKEASAFEAAMGLPENQRYLNGREFLRMLEEGHARPQAEADATENPERQPG